jgi:hypothetical protein
MSSMTTMAPGGLGCAGITLCFFSVQASICGSVFLLSFTYTRVMYLLSVASVILKSKRKAIQLMVSTINPGRQASPIYETKKE